MFSFFQNKILTGLDIAIIISSQQIRLETFLECAFDNDFDQIIKSGNRIKVFFNVEIKKNKRKIVAKRFLHEVTYDLLEKEFNVYLEEQKLDFTTKSYSEVIEMLSIFKYNQALNHKLQKNYQ